jgi:hypothetical protein
MKECVKQRKKVNKQIHKQTKKGGNKTFLPFYVSILYCQIMKHRPGMQKIQIILFFFENRLHWQFEVRLLLFSVCICI